MISLVTGLVVTACGGRPSPRAPGVRSSRTRPAPSRDAGPATPPIAPSWRTTGLAPYLGGALALRIDADGRPQAAALDGHLRVLTPSGVSADPMPAGVSCGSPATDASWLPLSAGGALFAQELGTGSRVLIGARCDRTELEPSLAASSGGAAIDATGSLHVCHVGLGADLRYGSAAAVGPIRFETIETGFAGCALDVASDRSVHVVAETRDGALVDFVRAPGTTAWRRDPVGPGVSPRLTRGPSGELLVLAATSARDGTLLLRRRDASGWREPVGDLVLRPVTRRAPHRIAVGSDGTVHIVAQAGSALRYARRSSGAASWQIETLDVLAHEDPDAATLDLALGPDGEPWVLFASAPRRVVALAHRGRFAPETPELPFDLEHALLACARHTVARHSMTSAALGACRQLVDERARTLGAANRRCDLGDAGACFAAAMLSSGRLPQSYRATLAPHERGRCPSGSVCRRTSTRFVTSSLGPAAGTEEDAVRAFGLACERGSIDACVAQGAMIGNRDAAVVPFMRACAAGRPSACVVPIDRLPALDPNSTRAAELVRVACEAGDHDACATRGAMLAEGYGDVHDMPAALALYTRACGPEPELVRLPSGGSPRDDPATLADERYALERSAERLFACAGLLVLYDREETVRRRLVSSAAEAVVAAECGRGAGDALSCVALARVLERGVGPARNRRRVLLARQAACAAGDRQSCPEEAPAGAGATRRGGRAR